MKLSKPAAINAFLCPGLGHIAAGWRVTGALIAMLAVVSVASPFAAFIWGVFMRPDCWEGMWPCTKSMLGHAWHLTWPVLLVCVPVFAVVYVTALVHGTTLTLPSERA